MMLLTALLGQEVTIGKEGLDWAPAGTRSAEAEAQKAEAEARKAEAAAVVAQPDLVAAFLEGAAVGGGGVALLSLAVPGGPIAAGVALGLANVVRVSMSAPTSTSSGSSSSGSSSSSSSAPAGSSAQDYINVSAQIPGTNVSDYLKAFGGK